MPARVTSPLDTAVSGKALRHPGHTPPQAQDRDRLILALLCALTLLVGSVRGATTPFWFDEVATAHIAAAPTWHGMLQLSRQVDLHPPLEDILVRFSFRLFGPHEFAGHLPSVLALTLAVGCVFAFLRRRVAWPYAVLGALLPLANTEFFSSVTQARPYGVFLGAVCAGVLAYDTVLRGVHLRLARLALAVALLTMLQAHLFGTFAAGSFVLAEGIRTMRLRRVDGPLWLALLLPWLSCVTYVPLLKIQGASQGSPMVYEERNRTSLARGLLFYHQALYLPLAPLLKFVVIVLVCVRSFPSRAFRIFFQAPPELAALLLTLLAAPVLVTVLLYVRAPESGFFARYGIAAACPASLLLAGLIAWRAGENFRVSLLLLAATVVACAGNLTDLPEALRSVAHNGLFAAPPGLDQTGGVERLCPHLPLVINDSLHFLEFDFHLRPSTEKRMVYVSDPAASLRLEHENATQAVVGLSRAFATPHRVVPASPFLAAHPDFVLLVRPRHTGWLTDLLAEQHARTRWLGHFKFAGSNADLWLVSQLGALPIAAQPDCPAH